MPCGKPHQNSNAGDFSRTTDGTGRACTLRRAQHWRCLPRVSCSQLHRFFGSRENALDHLLPGRNSMAHFVLIKAVENVPPEIEPRAIGIVVVDQVFPGLQRELEFRFFFPRDRRYLELFIAVRIKYRATEQEIQGQIAFAQAVEVFCRPHIEVEGAWDLKLHDGLFFKSGNNHNRIRPEHVLQGLAPAAWLAKKVEKLGLLFGGVAATGDLDLNLRAENNGMNRRLWA